MEKTTVTTNQVKVSINNIENVKPSDFFTCCVCYEETKEIKSSNISCGHDLCLVCCKKLVHLRCPMCNRTNVFKRSRLSKEERRIIKKRKFVYDNTEIYSYEASYSTSSDEVGEVEYDDEMYYNLAINFSHSSSSSENSQDENEDNTIDYPEEESEEDEKEKNTLTDAQYLISYDYFPSIFYSFNVVG